MRWPTTGSCPRRWCCWSSASPGTASPGVSGYGRTGADGEQRVDDAGVELRHAVVPDELERVALGPGAAVGPVGGERVEHVRHRCDPPGEGDLGSGQPSRVAASVHAFVMGPGNLVGYP